MELMGPMLLCALLTVLPRAQGDYRRLHFSNSYNNESTIRKNMKDKIFMQKKLLLNLNGLPLVNKVSPLQSLFMDEKCQHCSVCMEKAIKSIKKHRHIMTAPSKEDLHYDIMSEEQETQRYRFKREQNFTLKTKKSKNKKVKRSQTQKSVTVTKYTRDGVAYALKVEEMESKNNTCQVYKVRSSYACSSHEGDLIKALAKKRNKKGSKREAASTITTSKTTTTKQNVDNSHVAQDSFLPSIEFY